MADPDTHDRFSGQARQNGGEQTNDVHPQPDRRLADELGLTDAIKSSFAAGKTGAEVRAHLADRLTFLSKADVAAFINNVRQTLDIPPVVPAVSAAASTPAPTGVAAAAPAGRGGMADQKPADDGRAATSPEPLETSPTDVAGVPQQNPPVRKISPDQELAAFDDDRTAPDSVDHAEDAGAARLPDVAAVDSAQIVAGTDNSGPAVPAVDPSAPDQDATARAAESVKKDAANGGGIQPAAAVAAPEAPSKPAAEAAADEERTANTATKQEPANISFYGPGAALGSLLAAMRKPDTEKKATITTRTTDVASQAERFEAERMDPRREEALLAPARKAGNQTLQSLKALQDNRDMAVVLNRIADAAKTVGMATVIAEMRTGGQYEGLREQFNAALNETSSLPHNYDNTLGTLANYATERAKIHEILKARPQARQDFEDLDETVTKRFRDMPGRKDGLSSFDEAVDAVKDVLKNAADTIRNVFARKSNPTTRLAPGPSPGP